MVEGRGYAGRREERLRIERLKKFIDDRDRITVIPDVAGAKSAETEARPRNNRQPKKRVMRSGTTID